MKACPRVVASITSASSSVMVHTECSGVFNDAPMLGKHGIAVICYVASHSGVHDWNDVTLLSMQVHRDAATMSPYCKVARMPQRYRHMDWSPRCDSTIEASGLSWMSAAGIGIMMQPQVRLVGEPCAKNCINSCNHEIREAESVALVIASNPLQVSGKSCDARNPSPGSVWMLVPGKHLRRS